MKIEDFNSFFGTRVKLQCITVSDVSIVDVYKLCLEYKELFKMIPFKNYITSFLCNSNLLSFYKEYKDIIDQDNPDEMLKIILMNQDIQEKLEAYLEGMKQTKVLFFNVREDGDINLSLIANKIEPNFEKISSFYNCDLKMFKTILDQNNFDKNWKNKVKDANEVLNDLYYSLIVETLDDQNCCLYYKKDNGVMFYIKVVNDKTVIETIMDEIEFHLRKIDSKNKDYYKDCDHDYLQGPWKDQLLQLRKDLYSHKKRG